MALAPLSLVQAVAAGGVGVLAIVVHRFGTPLVARERWGATIAVGGLVLLGLSLAVHVAPSAPAHTATLLIVIGVGCGLAGLLAVVAAAAIRPAASLGTAAGILFGVGDLATKGAVDGNGLIFVPILAACAALAFVALQLAFQRGRVLETAGLSVLVNNLIPIVGGLALFHEALPDGLGRRGPGGQLCGRRVRRRAAGPSTPWADRASGIPTAPRNSRRLGIELGVATAAPWPRTPDRSLS